MRKIAMHQPDLGMRPKLEIIDCNPDAVHPHGFWRFMKVREAPKLLAGGCALYDISGEKECHERMRAIVAKWKQQQRQA